MKGIIMAGGKGSRLAPMTGALSKHLLPVYDKPMVHYPLATLMQAGIRDILLITSTAHLPLYKALLGDGSHLGITIEYKGQDEAMGIAHGIVLAEEFLGDSPFILILGDNIFYGQHFIPLIQDAIKRQQEGATIFGYYVRDPTAYGVMVLESGEKLVDIEEKPPFPKSHYAVTGLYIYDNSAINLAKNLIPSERGELEITDLNRKYLRQGKLNDIRLGKGIAWLDTGTPDSLLEAAIFVQAIEKRQGLKIGCLEEIAWRLGYISNQQLLGIALNHTTVTYGRYLRRLHEEIPIPKSSKKTKPCILKD